MTKTIEILIKKLELQSKIKLDAEDKLKQYPKMNENFRIDFNNKIKVANNFILELEQAIEILKLAVQPDVIKLVCICEDETGGYRYSNNDKTKCSTCGKEKQTVITVCCCRCGRNDDKQEVDSYYICEHCVDW